MFYSCGGFLFATGYCVAVLNALWGPTNGNEQVSLQLCVLLFESAWVNQETVALLINLGAPLLKRGVSATTGHLQI